MGRHKVATLLLAVILLAALVTGCGGQVAATVNGKKIYMKEIEEQLEDLRKRHGQQMQEEDWEKMKERFKKSILDFLIEKELTLSEAEKMGIKVTDKEIDERIDQMRKMFPSKKEFEEALKQQGTTLEELKKQTKEQIIIDKVTQKLSKGQKITDKEVKKYYDEKKDQFKESEQVKVRQVVLTDKKTANEVLSKLDDGEDFAKLAKKYSEDGATKNNGGEVGWKTKDSWTPELAEAAFKLSAGETSKVIEVQKMYYIIKVDEKKPETQKTFDEVKEQIKQTILSQKQNDKYKQWVNDLKKKADIKKNI